MSDECQAKDPATCRVHGNKPKVEKVTVEEALSILEQKPIVTDPNGQKVRFGERLLRHIREKPQEEQARRLVKLRYAMDAVETTKPIIHPRGKMDRNAYVKKTSENSSVLVLVDNSGEVQEVFDVFSKNTKEVRKSLE